jgi:hypothetical protein
LPHRLHRGPFTDRPVRLYFPLNLPIAGSEGATTFVYADPGGPRRLQSDRLRAWVTDHAALWEALRDGGGAARIVAVTRTDAAAAANAAVLESWRGPPAPAVLRSDADQRLMEDYESAKETGDLRPLDRYGGMMAAVNAVRLIREREKAARWPSKYIDAYSTHVALRLAPDLLTL